MDAAPSQVLPYAGDGQAEALGPDRCRLRLGSWSWSSLAAGFARFDAELEVLDPPELREAFAELARRAERAAGVHRQRPGSLSARGWLRDPARTTSRDCGRCRRR